MPSVTAICLSYRRPANMPRVVAGLLEASCIRKIIVSNNNPEVTLDPLPPDPRVSLVTHARQMPAATRFFMASELEGKMFLSIDDDLFLDGSQIDRLVSFLVEDPQVPHGGPWGQKLVNNSDSTPALKGWFYPDDEVDVLNRAYAFTKEHASKFVQLCGLLGMSSASEVGPWDDVLISHTGPRRPRTHDLGPWQSCPSSNDSAVALWMQPGFHETRLRLFARLRRQLEIRL